MGARSRQRGQSGPTRLAVVGLVDGLAMALKKKVANCPDGLYFPKDAPDFTRYVHPQAGLGIGSAALSVILGILIGLCSMVVQASLEARPPSV